MRKIILSIISIPLALLSLNVFADKLVITGEPIVIEKQGDVYVPQSVLTPGESYYYFSVGESQRVVCYKEVNPDLVSVDAGIFGVRVGSDVEQMHCYTYTP